MRKARITDVGKVLAAFPLDGSCIRYRQLVAATGLDPYYVSRKVHVLLGDGLAYSHVRGCYKLTEEGKRLRAAHVAHAVTEIVAFAGRRRAGDGLPLSDRLWAAVRMARRGGLSDFLQLAANDTDRHPRKLADSLLRLWHRHGVVQRVSAPHRRPVRYCLVRDLGPRRPCSLEGRLFDPNARCFLEEVAR